MGLTFSARKKNLDLMLLFVTDPDVKRNVTTVRRKLGIPLEGFKTDADYDAWLINLANDYTKLAESGQHSASAFMKFIRVPRLLVERHHLPEHYAEHVRRHILYGTVSASLNNFDMGPFPIDMRPEKASRIPMNIYTALTDDEWRDAKKIQKLMGRHLPSYQPLKNVERRIANEQKIAERDAHNHNENREYKLSLAEMSGGKIKTVYADIRELKDLRKKHLGK